MSLIYGTGSFTRFKVDGDPREDYLETFPKSIARYAFRNLDETSDEERSAGWVNIRDMFDSEFAEFFLQCFGLHLKAVYPHALASEMLEREGMDSGLLEGLRYSIETEGY